MILLDRLAELFPTAKRTTLRRMIEAGRVSVNGIPARAAKQELAPEDSVKVLQAGPEGADDQSDAPPKLPFEIVFEDQDVIVINKPAGLLTSTVPAEKRPTAWSLLRADVRRREPGTHVALIHRLDRDASGLLIFSKNSKAYDSLKLQFREHSIERVYTAIVHGTPKPLKDRIRTRLIELPDGRVRSTPNPDNGEEAISDYEVMRTIGKHSVVRVQLYTGRKHQIRAHLSERGHAIVGDSVYGEPSARRAERQSKLLLAATKLIFRHPRTLESIKVQSELPAVMRAFIAELSAEPKSAIG